MQLPVMPPVLPMLAKLSRGVVPEGEYQYEPKWDGFRAIVYRDGDEIEIGSRNTKSLVRYFPEVVEALKRELPERCVLDGEIIVVTANGLDFDALSLRVHPAESRVQKLSKELPASFVAFDVLALDDVDLRSQPLRDRHAALVDALRDAKAPVYVTPSTNAVETARDWFERFESAGFDGIVAKPLDDPYVEDARTMLKVKHEHTADVVVAGYRLHKDGNGVGSLLLGLFDDDGALHHVGVASSMAGPLRAELLAHVQPLVLDDTSTHPWAEWSGGGEPEARMPGAPSRWNATKDLSWVPLRPDLVAEVRYEHLQPTGPGSPGRFRHTARFLRWRPDRDPESCGFAQLDVPEQSSILDLLGGAET